MLTLVVLAVVCSLCIGFTPLTTLPQVPYMDQPRIQPIDTIQAPPNVDNLTLTGVSTCANFYWYSDDWRRVINPDPRGASYGFERESWQDVATRVGWTYVADANFSAGGNYSGQNWAHVYWQQYNKGNDFRPLGFRYGYFGPLNIPTACLHADGVAGFKVELMVFSLSKNARLCYADMLADTFNGQDVGSVPNSCAIEKLYGCFDADTTTNIMSVAVHCANGVCPDGMNTEFLWRFRKSGLRWSDPRFYVSAATEMWCNMIASQVEWPDHLLGDLPTNFKAPNDEDPQFGVSSNANTITILSAIAVAVVAALYQ